MWRSRPDRGCVQIQCQETAVRPHRTEVAAQTYHIQVGLLGFLLSQLQWHSIERIPPPTPSSPLKFSPAVVLIFVIYAISVDLRVFPENSFWTHSHQASVLYDEQKATQANVQLNLITYNTQHRPSSLNPATAALSPTKHVTQMGTERTCTRDIIANFMTHKHNLWHAAPWLIMYRTSWCSYIIFCEVRSPTCVIFYTYYVVACPQRHVSWDNP